MFRTEAACRDYTQKHPVTEDEPALGAGIWSSERSRAFDERRRAEIWNPPGDIYAGVLRGRLL